MTPPTPLPPPGAILVDPDGPVVVCDVAALTRPDLAALDALARMQLTARRAGTRMQLRGASPTLVGLLALTGLQEVLPLLGSVEPHRQPEQREQRLDVQERIDPGDTAT